MVVHGFGMARRAWQWVIPCLLCALLGGSPIVNARPSSQADTMLQLVNNFRAANGLAPYTYNGALAAAAQSHAQWMADTNTISHTESNGTIPQNRADSFGYVGRVTENIVGGTKLSPQGGFTWWQNSSIHLQMMLSSFYAEAGVGFATDGNWNYYALVMGRPGGYSGSTRVEDAAAPAAAASSDSNANSEPAPMIVAPIVTSTPNPDGSITHIVQPGHTFWAISARYEIPLLQLLQNNNLTEESVLHPGEKLTIKFADDYVPPPTPTPPLTYQVKKGDSAWVIAIRYQIPLATFFLYNGMTELMPLREGQVVKVRLAPGESLPPTATPISHHRVTAGQTYWTIAAIYRIPLDSLLAWNGLTIDHMLQPGDLLLVRGELAPPTPTAIPATIEPTLAPSAVPLPTLVITLPFASPSSMPSPDPSSTPIPTPVPTALPPTPTPTPTVSSSVAMMLVGGSLLGFGGSASLLLWFLWKQTRL